MNNQDTERQPITSAQGAGGPNRLGATARAAVSKATDIAQDVTDKAMQAGSEAVSSVSTQVKEVLDRQVGSGGEVLGTLAASTRRAADDLEASAPLISAVVRTLGQRMDGYADNLQGQTVDQLLLAATDITKRRPALVFGLAALAGFMTCRTLKSAPSSQSTSNPKEPVVRHEADQFHG